MRAVLIYGLLIIVSGCAKAKETPGQVVRQFIQAVAIDADWTKAQSLSDSLAAIKIQNSVMMRSLHPENDPMKMQPACFSLTDSIITDSLAVFYFHLWFTDSLRPEITHESGYARLMQSADNLWRITDYGYNRTRY